MNARSMQIQRAVSPDRPPIRAAPRRTHRSLPVIIRLQQPKAPIPPKAAGRGSLDVRCALQFWAARKRQLVAALRTQCVGMGLGKGRGNTGPEHRRTSPETANGQPPLPVEFSKVLTAAVRQFTALQGMPDPFGRVEERSVGG